MADIPKDLEKGQGGKKTPDLSTKAGDSMNNGKNGIIRKPTFKELLAAGDSNKS